MPQIVIKKSDLPAVGKNGTYTIRARIVSDDRNNVSYWTPIYNLILPPEGSKFVKDAVMANVYHNPIGQSLPQNYNIYVSWHDPNQLGFYDVYTQWRHADGTWTPWMHFTTLATRNFAFNPPLYLTQFDDPTTFFDMYKVSVTRANFHKEYNPDLALFSTASMPLGGISLV